METFWTGYVMWLLIDVVGFMVGMHYGSLLALLIISILGAVYTVTMYGLIDAIKESNREKYDD